MLSVTVKVKYRETTTRSGGLLWRQHHRRATSLAAAGGTVEPQRLHEIERHKTRQRFWDYRGEDAMVECDEADSRIRSWIIVQLDRLELPEPDEPLVDVPPKDYIDLVGRPHIHRREPGVEPPIVDEVVWCSDGT